MNGNYVILLLIIFKIFKLENYMKPNTFEDANYNLQKNFLTDKMLFYIFKTTILIWYIVKSKKFNRFFFKSK